MKNPSLYQSLKQLSLPPGDDRKEVIRVRLLLLKDQAQEHDLEKATELLAKYAEPLSPCCSDNITESGFCADCGEPCSDDYDSDYPRVFNPALSDTQNINRLVVNALGGVVLAVIVGAALLAPIVLDAKELPW